MNFYIHISKSNHFRIINMNNGIYKYDYMLENMYSVFLTHIKGLHVSYLGRSCKIATQKHY